MESSTPNSSFLSNEKVLLDFFKLKYDYLPNSLGELDSDIYNTLKVIDDAYIEKSISFEEAFNLMSQLFNGFKIDNDFKNDLAPDKFYSLLLEGELDRNRLDDLFYNKKISYQLYFDGINYLSREVEDDISFSR